MKLEKRLANVDHDPTQPEAVSQVKSFLAQSKAANEHSDEDLAHNLAVKTYTLATSLQAQ